QGGELPAPREIWLHRRGDLLHQQRVLGDGEGMVSHRLAVPARHAGKAVGDVLDLDVLRRGIEQVEPPPRQHPLPGARRTGCRIDARSRALLAHARPRSTGALKRRCSSAQASWRWQLTRWSLTMPVACMKA